MKLLDTSIAIDHPRGVPDPSDLRATATRDTPPVRGELGRRPRRSVSNHTPGCRSHRRPLPSLQTVAVRAPPILRSQSHGILAPPIPTTPVASPSCAASASSSATARQSARPAAPAASTCPPPARQRPASTPPSAATAPPAARPTGVASWSSPATPPAASTPPATPPHPSAIPAAPTSCSSAKPREAHSSAAPNTPPTNPAPTPSVPPVCSRRGGSVTHQSSALGPTDFRPTWFRPPSPPSLADRVEPHARCRNDLHPRLHLAQAPISVRPVPIARHR